MGTAKQSPNRNKPCPPVSTSLNNLTTLLIGAAALELSKTILVHICIIILIVIITMFVQVYRSFHGDELVFLLMHRS